MSYLTLYRRGELERRKKEINSFLKQCALCPRRCRINRLAGEVGFCQAKKKAKVNSFFLHFGEERELVGRGGSGTIFFSHCNLGCLYCQNYTISHLGEGKEVDAKELAGMMLTLQEQGAENINFVTPTHIIPAILEGLYIAAERGLKLPLVYNCGGYENKETLKLLEGVFDIYMPDIKYSNSAVGGKFSSACDYWEVAQQAVKEMHRQVGDLVTEGKRAVRGLLIRHLVLPQQLAGSFKILDFIKREISPHTYVNIMQQYHPCYRAGEFKELSGKISWQEYREIIEYARGIGLYRGF